MQSTMQQGISFPTNANTKIHKYKYTNTGQTIFVPPDIPFLVVFAKELKVHGSNFWTRL